nr:hypothetical protein [Tanacetum cinerariifolium]
MGLERQHAGAAARSAHVDPEEEVHRLDEILVQQGALIDRLSIDPSGFTIKMIDRTTQLMDANGLSVFQNMDTAYRIPVPI